MKISPNRVRKRALEGFMKEHLFEGAEMEIAREWSLKRFYLSLSQSDSVREIIREQAGKILLGLFLISGMLLFVCCCYF